MTTCLNCENNFEGAFCNQCGQKAATHRFTMHEWFHEIPHSIWHVDSGFFKTIVRLTTHNGEAIREYLAGKRKSLFSPFLYLLIMCGIYVVASHFLLQRPETGSVSVTNLGEAEKYIKLNYYKILVVAMVIPVTIGTYVAFIRSGFNFAENLVLNAYVTGQLVIVDIILMVVALSTLDEQHLVIYKIIEALLKYPIWLMTYWRFFRPSKWYWGVLQIFLAQVLTSVALYGLIIGAAFAVLKLKGH